MLVCEVLDLEEFFRSSRSVVGALQWIQTQQLERLGALLERPVASQKRVFVEFVEREQFFRTSTGVAGAWGSNCNVLERCRSALWLE